MRKKRKLIRNVIILVLLLILTGSFSTVSFTPLAAHIRSERTANYGPSTIIKSQKIKNGMLYLCKYDKWYSANTVIRGFLGLWYPGSEVYGKENDPSKPLDYSFSISSKQNKYTLGMYYGMVNNPDIKSVKFDILLNGERRTLEQKDFYDGMFLFVWEEDSADYMPISLTGLDKDSRVIYEEKF